MANCLSCIFLLLYLPFFTKCINEVNDRINMDKILQINHQVYQTYNMKDNIEDLVKLKIKPKIKVKNEDKNIGKNNTFHLRLKEMDSKIIAKKQNLISHKVTSHLNDHINQEFNQLNMFKRPKYKIQIHNMNFLKNVPEIKNEFFNDSNDNNGNNIQAFPSFKNKIIDQSNLNSLEKSLENSLEAPKLKNNINKLNNLNLDVLPKHIFNSKLSNRKKETSEENDYLIKNSNSKEFMKMPKKPRDLADDEANEDFDIPSTNIFNKGNDVKQKSNKDNYKNKYKNLNDNNIRNLHSQKTDRLNKKPDSSDDDSDDDDSSKKTAAKPKPSAGQTQPKAKKPKASDDDSDDSDDDDSTPKKPKSSATPTNKAPKTVKDDDDDDSDDDSDTKKPTKNNNPKPTVKAPKQAKDDDDSDDSVDDDSKPATKTPPKNSNPIVLNNNNPLLPRNLNSPKSDIDSDDDDSPTKPTSTNKPSNLQPTPSKPKPVQTNNSDDDYDDDTITKPPVKSKFYYIINNNIDI